MNNIKLNHEAEKLSSMLNLTSEDGSRIRNIITFETIKSSVLLEELYENESVAPRNIKTKSGCIERCLNYLDKNEELALFFMIFLSLHEDIHMAHYVYKHMEQTIEKYISRQNINDDDSIENAFKKFLLDKTKNTIKEEFDNINDDDSIENAFKKFLLDKTKNTIKEEFDIFNDVINCMKQANYNYELFEDIYSEKHGDLTNSLSKAVATAKRNFGISNNDED